MKNTMSILFGLVILIVFLCFMICSSGCRMLKTTPPTRHTNLNKTNISNISQIIDDSVAKELPKALSEVVGQNVMDYGPYGIIALMSLWLGKKHIDLRDLKKIKKV